MTDWMGKLPHKFVFTLPWSQQLALKPALIARNHQTRKIIEGYGKLNLPQEFFWRAALTDELLKWRSEFPILDKTVYLISHSLGAMPRGTYARLNDYAETWATRGVRAWAEGWWDMPVTVGNEVARIIGADPGTVVMHQNVSICEALVLSCLK